MYFAVIEVVPSAGSDAAKKYRWGHVACWVNSTVDWKVARKKAIALISSSGWTAKKVVEEKDVTTDNYSPSDEGLENYKQALIDNEVCVIFALPKAKRSQPKAQLKGSGRKS